MSNLSSTAADNALARELTQATRSGAQLGEALLAAAEGTSDRRLGRALTSIAERIKRGEPLDQILTKDSPLSAPLSGLMRASLVTGQPAMAISQWLFIREQSRAQWQNVMTALNYPLISLAATYCVFLFISLWLAPALKSMLENMTSLGVKLSAGTAAIYWFTEYGVAISLTLFGFIGAFLLLLRLIGGRSTWSQFVSAAPVLGPLWHWSGSSELLRALALLLDQQIPLPQALRLTGDGIRDAALARHAHTLAVRVEQGASLSQAMQALHELPASIFPLVRNGERSGTLPDALRTAAEMLASRQQAQASMILQLAPTVVFLLIAGMVVMMVAGFLAPLVQLIRGLS
ncbi:Type II secretion system protein F [Anatilimnocola aggregata]|uniref:Type II secretion system protein F n=1 Tax=Anatilimnocola aggregata TaxID=2528021 RepID=A0A517YI18_9BACT|nr:type II secretion system F family protein [Anatilimnocola aggregata]QDU29854.1 Type II secretion system protein F [Anatilimnocola aggregata]